MPYSVNNQTKIRLSIAFVGKLLILMILLACNNNDDLRLNMADGNQIHVISDKIVNYANESDFLHSYAPVGRCKYSFHSNNKGPYLQGEVYSIQGYDDRFIGYWEKAKFGDWIKKYGLEPSKTYYCATIKYVIYMPIPPANEEYLPFLPLNEMGYSPWTSQRSFETEYGDNYPKCVFCTYFRYIGYNENLAGVYMTLPLTDKLIWNFTVEK